VLRPVSSTRDADSEPTHGLARAGGRIRQRDDVALKAASSSIPQRYPARAKRLTHWLTWLVLFLVQGHSLSEAKTEWVEIRSAHFLLITDAGEAKGRNAIVEFERIRTFFRQSLVVANQHPSPLVVVLAAKDGDSVRELMPWYWTYGRTHLAGLYAEALDQHFAVVLLNTQRSGQYPVFYHEYYHSITSPEFPDLPLWLSEGLAEFYGYSQIKENVVSTGLADRERLNTLATARLLPLRDLFNVDHASPYYNESEKASIFYAESWLLTHYLMIGNPEAHKNLVAFLEALSRGKRWDQAIAAFGDLKKLQSDLEAYSRQKKFLSINSPLPNFERSDLQVRGLSKAEIDAYAGGFSAALGYPQAGVRISKKALKEDGNLSLGYVYLAMDQNSEDALKSAADAVRLDPSNTYARYLRAYIVTYQSGMLSTDVPVKEDLRHATLLNQDFSPPYALLGEYLALRTPKLEEGLALVKQAVLFDPSSSTYQLALARVLMQMNKYDAARTAASRATALARNSAESQHAQAFTLFLDQASKKNEGNASK
jgi:hypothetical protein